MKRFSFQLHQILLPTALLGLAAGMVAWLLHEPHLGDQAWLATTLLVLVPTAISVLRGLFQKQTGVDIIALLAMAGALILHENLAAAIIAVMLTGGNALETYAVARARRELTALLQRAPREAHRLSEGTVVNVDVADVRSGDVLLVKGGEVIPTDGILLSSSATLDESALTGESRPGAVRMGDALLSGAVNAGSPIEMRATAAAAASTYARIISLVRSAETAKAPFVRLADRYAVIFLVATLALAGGVWLLSGQPIRALSVLVVATPCPLILAAPAAIIAGLSAAARQGIIMKGGGALETLAKASVVLLDKTGTITRGRARVIASDAFADIPADELLRLAASVEQLSTHPFAPAIIAAARDRNLQIAFPADAKEQLGAGIVATVEGRRVAIGQLGWVSKVTETPPTVRAVQRRTAAEGSSSVFISVDGTLHGVLILEDPIRTEAPRALHALRRLGIRRIAMVTGDHPDVAELVGDAVGIDEVFAERTPEEKVSAVRAVRAQGVTVMVGDGVNDAPALALADVGIAMGARGASAASEAADIVLTGDRLEGLVVAVQIARRTRRIALQSVLVGMALSGLAMVAAALGFLAPVKGAVLQEAIDLTVIANALRALGQGSRKKRVPAHDRLGRELSATHSELRAETDELAAVASRLEGLSPPQALLELQRVKDFLVNELLPHERDEQTTAYPLVAKLLPGEDPTGPLVRTHQEIARLVRLFARLVEQLPVMGPQPEDLRDIRRILYGLNAILTLHFAQEDELYALLSTARAEDEPKRALAEPDDTVTGRHKLGITADPSIPRD